MKMTDAKVRESSVFSQEKKKTSGRLSLFTSDKRYEIVYIPINQIIPYRKQARKIFDEKEIEILALTIREHGMRQPLTVLRVEGETILFEVISGERRLRAAKIACLNTIPCIVVEDEKKAEEIALIENVQRKDLHPLEAGRALKALIEERGWGAQTELRSKTGFQSSKISELIKLTTLSPEVQNVILEENFHGRDQFRKLFSFQSDAKKINYIKGQKKSSKTKTKPDVKSVLRFSFDEGVLKIQKQQIQFLSQEEKIKLKESLVEILKEIDG